MASGANGHHPFHLPETIGKERADGNGEDRATIKPLTFVIVVREFLPQQVQRQEADVAAQFVSGGAETGPLEKIVSSDDADVPDGHVVVVRAHGLPHVPRDQGEPPADQRAVSQVRRQSRRLQVVVVGQHGE